MFGRPRRRATFTTKPERTEPEYGILDEPWWTEVTRPHANPYNKQLDLTKADWEKRGVTLPPRGKHVAEPDDLDDDDLVEYLTEQVIEPRSASSHLNHGRTTT